MTRSDFLFSIYLAMGCAKLRKVVARLYLSQLYPDLVRL